MIEVKITANSVAELNTKLLQLLGFDTRCDECRAELEDEDYEEELCNCESCVAEREMTDCERIMADLEDESDEPPTHFIDWLNNTQYFKPTKTVRSAYDNYWQSNYFKKASDRSEYVLSLNQFSDLMAVNGYSITTVDGENYITKE